MGTANKLVLANLNVMVQTFFGSIFPCLFCERPSSGYCYFGPDNEGNCGLPVDVECGLAPKTIKHASHKQHVLYQTMPMESMLGTTFIPPSCCSSTEFFGFNFYRCVTCDFYIHIKCALLPKRTRHKFDEHQLEHITSATHHKADDCLFCEICEQDIDHKYWFYGCGKCEQYFHINCIPSVGYLSKVKFGETIVDNNIHRDRPLTLTRMIDVRRHERCGACNQIIKCLPDEEQMAFNCSLSDFWIHFSCAVEFSCDGLLNYSQFLEFVRQPPLDAVRQSPLLE